MTQMNTESTNLEAVQKPLEKYTKRELFQRVVDLEQKIERLQRSHSEERNDFYSKIDAVTVQLRLHERFFAVIEARAGTQVPF